MFLYVLYEWYVVGFYHVSFKQLPTCAMSQFDNRHTRHCYDCTKPFRLPLLVATNPAKDILRKSVDPPTALRNKIIHQILNKNTSPYLHSVSLVIWPLPLMKRTALRNKIIHQILNKNTSPYLHSVSLVIWPLPLMKRTHFSELSISRFSTYIRKAQGWTLHFRTPDPRSEQSQRKFKMTGRTQIQRRIQAHIL